MDRPPLYPLPPEIRNRIYDYALHEPHGIRISTTSRREPRPFGPSPARPSTSSRLQEVSRALRHETRQLYFWTNRLVVHCASQPRREDADGGEGGTRGEEEDCSLRAQMGRLRAWSELVGVEHSRALRRVTFALPRYEGSLVGRAVRVLRQEIEKLRGRWFSAEAVFEVNFLVPCWDKVGRCLPVNVVLWEGRGRALDWRDGEEREEGGRGGLWGELARGRVRVMDLYMCQDRGGGTERR